MRPVSARVLILVLAAAGSLAGGCSSGSPSRGSATSSPAPAGPPPVAPVCNGSVPPSSGWTVVDGFCRDVTTRGITLVDWDGHLANPAVAITVAPPSGATLPITLSVSADEPRVYWDR